MKTRRALQIIVGILSLLVVFCLLVAAAGFVFLLYARDGIFEAGSDAAVRFYQGLNMAAETFGFNGELAILVPALFFGLPIALLLLAAILLFLHKTNKQAKYVAGSVLALTGMTVLAAFTIWFAPELVYGLDTNYAAEFSWTSIDTIVRFAVAGLLGVFVIFVGSALGVKPKRESVAEADETVATVEGEVEVAEVTEEQEASETATEEVVEEQLEEPVVEEQASEIEASNETVEEAVEETQTQEPVITPLSEETPATEYVPNTDITVNDIVQNTYGGREEELSADAVAKIGKLRSLYEANAISQDEYIKLVNIYLGKKA